MVFTLFDTRMKEIVSNLMQSPAKMDGLIPNLTRSGEF
jgi:hypothetical protein